LDEGFLPFEGAPGTWGSVRRFGGTVALRRDAIGHQSLFYRVTPDGVHWGRRLSGVAATGASLHFPSLSAYFSCAYSPGPETLLVGHFAVEPGTEVHISKEGVRRLRQWELPASPTEESSEAELQASLRAGLEAAVVRRLPQAGVPVAATVSGGVDSSLVVALVRRLYTGELSAHSIAFGPEHANELEFSGAVAQHLGIPHRVLHLSPQDISAAFDATIASLAELNGDPLTVPNYLMFREVGGGCLFNGEGGDPCFGGPKNAPMMLDLLLGVEEDSLPKGYLRAHQRLFDDLSIALRPEVLERSSTESLETTIATFLESPRWPGFVDRLMAINVIFKGAWHILPKVESLGAAHGVMPCSPLFDRELVELAFRIPGPLKRKGAIEKYLLKQAVSDLLPTQIVERPKSGMMVPVEHWFSGPLKSWASERLLDGLARFELFDRRWLENLVRGKTGGLRPRRGIKIWQLLTLESWLRTVGVVVR